MKLSDLLNYDSVIIQCHNNPDADSIASGFALLTWFREKGKNARLIYSGKAQISKPNLLLMVQELNIPIEHVESINGFDGLLITVDSQYGAGNIKRHDVKNVAIIDHHQQEIFDVPLTEIRSFLGSCSTLVWDMLVEEGFDVNNYPEVSTALWYGLFCDTNGFSELNHPIDRDMRDTLVADKSLARRLRNSNLTLLDLETAGMALIRTSYNRKNRFAVIKTNPCDPNILGYISDLAHQVDVIDVCVVYNEINNGIKYSVRSSSPEIMASELAAWLANDIGSGGGHAEKAGGFISNHRFEKKYPNINADEYLLSKISEYYSSFDIIYAGKYEVDPSEMKSYRKLPVVYGYIRSSDVLPGGTPMMIRTLQGDYDDLVASDNLYLMIGIKGEVSPITSEMLEKNYTTFDEPYDLSTEYFPSIRNKITGESINLKNMAKKCISKGDVQIFAKPVTRATKVFTIWDRDTYMLAKPGDYLAVRKDNHHDIYIINKDVFSQIYEEMREE
ncbi:MAG: recombinase RecJ [Clostridiaceae bacterium]|nr:recombinase RecJ [Clostridiaceae bacterium]